MIFCEKLLFLHVPKTGGISITSVLLDVLPAPVYYSAPSGHHGPAREGIVFVSGKRHETLEDAEELLAEYEWRLEQFPAILACLRNPYELEVSRFAYLRKGHPWDRGVSQELALGGDFERFAADSPPHAHRQLEAYFVLRGSVPDNLRIVRLEEISTELPAVLRSVGITSKIRIPRTNRSRHRHYSRYYTPKAEEAVYRKYRWAFEEGGYERLHFD
jgi:hypothetical protein